MALQGALFLPKSDWVAPKISELPSWSAAQRVAVDIETCDPKLRELGPGVRRGGFIAGVAFAIEDGPAFYLPIAHEGGGNVDRDHALAYLRDQARNYKGTIVATNATYDLDYLAEVGVHYSSASWVRDVQVAEPLLDELQDTYNLDAIAKRYKMPGKDKSVLSEAVAAYGLKGNAAQHIWKLPAKFVAEYAIQDVFLPLKILRRQEKLIEEQDLWDIYNLESKLLPVLLKVRRRGVRFSHERLDAIESWSLAQEAQALAIVAELTSVNIAVGDVWSAEVMSKPLKAIGITPPTTAKGAPSITAEFLAEVKHPVADALARARKVNKIRTTFVQSIRDYAIGDRIHGVLNQLRKEKDDGSLGGAAYGRLSGEHPNMQQQPARDEEVGPMWRRIFIPDEGKLWACLDYSQQEPRLLTHYAEMTHCRGAMSAAQRYRDDPLTDNHQMMAELTGLPRKQAKNLFLGKCYGMGAAKMAKDCGLPTEWIMSPTHGRMIEVAGPEGKAIIEQFERRAPYVKELAQRCSNVANSKGYLKTVLGRRCRFPKNEDGKGYDWTHKALNRLIQGGSGDQTKAAMVAGDAAGYEIQLQVHDELDLSVTDRQQAEGLAEIMRTVVPLSVPSRVDVEVGPSWGEIE
jgi:DNA polymerase I-like protein with 3'-5' exonuclease and polymerase domains